MVRASGVRVRRGSRNRRVRKNEQVQHGFGFTLRLGDSSTLAETT